MTFYFRIVEMLKRREGIERKTFCFIVALKLPLTPPIRPLDSLTRFANHDHDRLRTNTLRILSRPSFTKG